MTRGDLITLAFGPNAVVDSAIPQPVFNGLTDAQRADVAGWIYSDGSGGHGSLFGVLLTQTECWQRIREKVERGDLRIVATSEPSEYLLPVPRALLQQDGCWKSIRDCVEIGDLAIVTPEELADLTP